MLRWLISAIGFAALKGEASSIAHRAGRRAILIVVLAIVWLAACGFALAALAAWLSAELGVVAACAIIAGGLAVIGLGVQLAMVLGARRKPDNGLGSRLAEMATSGTGAILPEGASLGTVAVIAAAGYLLGRQLFRR